MCKLHTLKAFSFRSFFVIIFGLSSLSLSAQTALKWATILSEETGETFEVYDSHFDAVGQQLLLTGKYTGTNFPATSGSTTSGGTSAAFIIAMDPDGSQIKWAKLIQGSSNDEGYYITTNESGDIFVLGKTNSSDFPINGTTAAFRSILNGDISDTSTDAFIHRYDPTGTTLRYGTFLGDENANGYYRGGSGLVAKGDTVYATYTAWGGANNGTTPTYMTPGFLVGQGVIMLNTAVGGSAGLEGLAWFHNYYGTGALAVAPNGEVIINGTYDMFASTSAGVPDPSTSDAILNQAEVIALSSDGLVYGDYDYVAKFSADLSSLEYSSFIVPVELSVTLGELYSYDYNDVELDDEGNIYVYANYWMTNTVAAVSYPTGATINNPFNMSIVPSTAYDQIGAVAKINANNLSTYEWITLIPSHEFGGTEAIEIDSRGQIHYNAKIIYDNAYPFSPLTTAGATLPSRNDITGTSSNGYNKYYLILNPDGTLKYSTLYQTGQGDNSTLTLDKASCTAYLTHHIDGSFDIDLTTPSYYNQDSSQQISVYNNTVSQGDGTGILVFHDPTPVNTITDFLPGNNTFCVGSLIYQNPNDGPILGDDPGYTSGDGSSATHSLPDFYFQGILQKHPDPKSPAAAYQWQVSRDNGTTWSNIDGATLSVLKPESETSAGTVQYRRGLIYSHCDTVYSNVATATISGALSLSISAPSDPVYYCEGTAESIPITISGASGNISWQWYNGFSPLSNSEINPASGSGVAQGSFTAELPTTQTEEGFYRLVVEDGSGCKKETSISFAKLSASAYFSETTAALCPGTTPEITLGPRAENTLWDYSWTGPSSYTSSEARPTVTATGDYFLQVKLSTDASFCAAGQTSVTVSSTTAHDAALTTIPDVGFCQSESPAAIGLSGTAPDGYSFQWAPGTNLNDQQAYSPTFDPGTLPFGITPVAEVEYTFTALRASDGCIFETTMTVSDTAFAFANAGSDQATCGSNSATLGKSETTGLFWQWEAVSTDFTGGLAALVSDPNFLIDGVNSNAGTQKFATIQAPAASSSCYDIYFVLRASYVAFPASCVSTDTVRMSVCPASNCSPCPDIAASLQGSTGICAGESSIITATTFEGFELEWTTYSVDGVVQAAGTAPQGLFENNNNAKGAALSATGPHTGEIIADFDDVSWGWSGANVVVYQVVTTGGADGITASCTTQVQVFSGQNGIPTIGVIDKSLCTFPSPGVELGSSGLSSPYTVSGSDYSSAPNSGLEWTWTEIGGGTTSLTANADTPFPTITQSADEDYLVLVRDASTGCEVRDTMSITMVSIVANAGSDITGVCEGSLVQLGSSEQTNHSYSWSPTTGLNYPIGIPNSTTARPYLTLPAAPSGITYTVNVTESTTGCQATDDITITTNTDGPTAISDKSYSNCSGTTRSPYYESAKTGHTYSWSVISGGGSLTWFSDVTSIRPAVSIPEGTSAGTYVFQVTKTKGNCGSTTALLTLTVNDPPTVDLGADVTANCTSPLTLLSTTQESGVSYQWTPTTTGLYTDAAGTTAYSGSSSTSNYQMYVEAPSIDTDYILRAYNTCYVRDTITVMAPSTMAVEAGPDVYYCPDSDPLTLGEANIGVSHSWTATGYNSDPGGIPATPSGAESTTMLSYLSSTSANQPTFSQSSAASGVFVYQLNSTDGSGCVASDEVRIIVPDLASGFAGSLQTICEGGSITIGASSPPSGYNFQWSAHTPSTEGSSIDDPILANPTVSPTTTTTYQVIATNIATGCEVVEYVTVSVTPKPAIADVSLATQCSPITPVDLTAQIPSYGSYFNQVWSINGVPGVTESTPTSVSPTETTDYYLIAENSQSCPDTSKVTVNVDNPQTPNITAKANTDCNTNTLDLADYQGTASDPSYTLEWHTDNSTNPATLLGSTVVGAGTYYLFETTANGCASSSDNIIVSDVSCPGPFPVEWLNFEVNREGKNARLTWTTATENNNDRFIIERSIDKISYQPMGSVKGLGNTDQPSNYSFLDTKLSDAKSSVVAYRLKQMDYDGGFSYSKTLELVLLDQETLTLLIYPNPAEQSLFVKYKFSSQATGDKNLRIYDVLSKEVFGTRIPASSHSGELNIAVSGWKKGYYYVSIASEGHVKVYKVMVK